MDKYPILDLENFKSGEFLEISLLNHQTQGVNHITPHKHDFFLFFLIEDGEGIHLIDFTKHELKNKQLHILLPEQVHEWNLSEKTKGFQLMISKKVFGTFASYLDFSPLIHFNHPTIVLSDNNFNTLKTQFILLKKELKKERLSWDIIYTNTALITQLIARELNDSFDDFTKLKSNLNVISYINLVDENYKTEKTVTYYANRLCISANYLNILCKQYAKISANTIIRNRILLESKRLLCLSNITIKEIADNLGFNDLAYFSNFFKEGTGMSPRKFRELL